MTRRLVFDLETTGLPRGRDAPPSNFAAYDGARALQIAYTACDDDWRPVRTVSRVVRPDGFLVAGTEVHGITPERAHAEGAPFDEVAAGFFEALREADVLYAHNARFDVAVLTSELLRRNMRELADALAAVPVRCTMLATIGAVGALNAQGRPKWPRLDELYAAATDGKAMPNAHDAEWDCINLCEAMRALRAKGMLLDF